MSVDTGLGGDGGAVFDMDDSGLDLDALLADPAEPEDDKDPTKKLAKFDTELQEARAANTSLLQKLDGALTQIDALQKRAKFDTTVDNRPEPAAPTIDLKKFKDDMANLIISDPGEFALRLQNTVDQLITQKVSAMTGPLATSGAGLEVQNFKMTQAQRDKHFDADAQAIFDEMLTQPGAVESLSQGTPQIRAQTLAFMADAAVGRAARKEKPQPQRRVREPLDLSGGQGISLGVETPATFQGEKLNAVQREILRSAQEAGIKDPKRIKAMLSDAKGDN